MRVAIESGKVPQFENVGELRAFSKKRLDAGQGQL